MESKQLILLKLQIYFLIEIIMFLSHLLVICLLGVSHSNQDFQTKKSLLDAWEEDGGASIDSDTRGEIVYDFFKNDDML